MLMITLVRLTIAPCQSNQSNTPHDSSFIMININHLSSFAKYNKKERAV